MIDKPTKALERIYGIADASAREICEYYLRRVAEQWQARHPRRRIEFIDHGFGHDWYVSFHGSTTSSVTVYDFGGFRHHKMFSEACEELIDALDWFLYDVEAVERISISFILEPLEK